MSGELPPGILMPSETELAESSGLSRTSVRNAIRQLREAVRGLPLYPLVEGALRGAGGVHAPLPGAELSVIGREENGGDTYLIALP